MAPSFENKKTKQNKIPTIYKVSAAPRSLQQLKAVTSPRTLWESQPSREGAGKINTLTASSPALQSPVGASH